MNAGKTQSIFPKIRQGSVSTTNTKIAPFFPTVITESNFTKIHNVTIKSPEIGLPKNHKKKP